MEQGGSLDDGGGGGESFSLWRQICYILLEKNGAGMVEGRTVSSGGRAMKGHSLSLQQGVASYLGKASALC